MRISRERLVSLVLSRLGENPSPASAFAGEEEGLSLRRLVAEIAPCGAANAILECPHESLDDFSRFGESVGRRPDGLGYVMLPDDFLRLVSFRMADWAHAVTEAALPGTPAWRLLSSPCVALRGSRSRPFCRLAQRGVGRVLEFAPYSCSLDEANEANETNWTNEANGTNGTNGTNWTNWTNETNGANEANEANEANGSIEVAEAIYIARPDFDAEGYMRLPASCLEPAIRNIAAILSPIPVRYES